MIRWLSLLVVLTLVGPLLAPRAAWADPDSIEFPPSLAPERFNQGLSEAAQGYAPDPAEEWFQTWNTYVQTRDGHHIFANVVLSNMGMGDNTCGLNLAITTPDKRTLLETIQLKGDNFSGQKGRLQVRCGTSVLQGDMDQLLLKGRTGKLALEVRLRRGAPGVSAGTMWLDEDHEDFVRYNVPHLGSRASGRLYYDGVWHPVEGVSAVEHLVQNVGLFRYSRIWHRLRVMQGDTAVLMGGFEPSEDYREGIYYLFLAKGGRILHVSRGLKVETSSTKGHEESGYEVPAAVKLALRDKGFVLSGGARRQHLIASFDVLQQLNPLLRFFVRTFFANPWIFRNESRVELTWQRDGGPVEKLVGTGMHEVVYVND